MTDDERKDVTASRGERDPHADLLTPLRHRVRQHAVEPIDASSSAAAPNAETHPDRRWRQSLSCLISSIVRTWKTGSESARQRTAVIVKPGLPRSVRTPYRMSWKALRRIRFAGLLVQITPFALWAAAR